MQLACNAMLRDPGDPTQWLPVELLIDQVHDLGFDAIDFQFGRGFRSCDPDYLESIRRACEVRGLPIGFLGVGSGFVGSANDADGNVIGVALDAAERKARLVEARAAIDAAVIVGAPLIRMFAGAIPAVTPDRERLWREQTDAVRQLCDYGGERGVRIGLHNHAPVAAPTANDILRWLAEVDHESVTHILDTGQWYGSPGASAEGRALPGVDYHGFMAQTVAHATYVRTKIYKIDTGVEELLDYPRIARILLDAGYDGVISLVYEDRNNTSEFRRTFADRHGTKGRRATPSHRPVRNAAACDYVESWRLGAAHLRSCFGLSD